MIYMMEHQKKMNKKEKKRKNLNFNAPVAHSRSENFLIKTQYYLNRKSFDIDQFHMCLNLFIRSNFF